MSRRISIAVVLLLGAAAPCLAKGVIRGTIRAPLDAPAGRLALVPLSAYRDVVVYLAKAPEKMEKKLAKKARKSKYHMIQEKLAFAPRVLTVATGDTVLVENRDRVYHNTFSVSPAKRFDLGKYPPGHVERVVFENAGVVNLHCDIHPAEAAFVVAVPTHVYAHPDSFGRFKLPKLPKGDYTVMVWHPRLGTISRNVTMPKKGDLTLDMSY